jgi:hypothetical protein
VKEVLHSLIITARALRLRLNLARRHCLTHKIARTIIEAHPHSMQKMHSCSIDHLCAPGLNAQAGSRVAGAVKSKKQSLI